MVNLIKLILFLPKKYIILFFSIIVIAILMSFFEVLVLSSIKPFIQSFSSINLNILSDEKIDYFDITFIEARKFLFTVILCGFSRIILIFFQYRIAGKISAQISSKAFEKIINQDFLNLKSANQSKFISILIQDIPRTSEAISNFASFISNSIILLFISSSLLVLETKLFLVSGLIISSIYLLILFIFSKRLKINGENITKFNYEETLLVKSTLASVVDFVVGGLLKSQVKKFQLNEIKLRKSYANTLIYAQIPRYIVETTGLSLFTFFILLSINSASGLLIFAQLGTLLFAFNRVLPSAQQCFSAYAFIKSSSLSINNLIFVKTLKTKKINIIPNIENKSFSNQKIFKTKGKNQISIRNLKYNYEKKIISYRDFTFEQGSPTAVLGKSGSGKTTLMELILKLLIPSQGEIRLNNLNIASINPSIYYKNISYLSQSPFLFSGSIYENILFGTNRNIDKNELYSNGCKLGLKEEFGDNFLDYQISDFGRNISGGQAQRFCLLKIISDIKPILILDEPTSALDKNTAMIFNDLLLTKTNKSILIVITHSKSQADLFPSKYFL